MSKYAIIDLEMCRLPKDKWTIFNYKTEIIQIGAVLVDENLEIVDSFMTLVKPQYGTIDDYIEKLTGIKQKDVSNAPSFEKAIELFTDWLPSRYLL